LPEGRTAAQAKEAMAGDGIILGGSVYELPCHQQPVFEGIDAGRSLAQTDRWCPNHICPPLTSGTSEDDAKRVGESLVRHLS